MRSEDRKQLPLPEREPSYGTAIGAWGDMFAALGNIQRVNRAFGLSDIGVVNYGFDVNQKVFLETQPCVREVIHVTPRSREDYLRLIGRSCQMEDPRREWLSEMLAGHPEVDSDRVWPTHVDFNCQTGHECEIFHGAELPVEIRNWARGVVGEGKPFLLNPYSTQSAHLRQHWPYWAEFVKWLDAEKYDFILVGTEPGDLGDWGPSHGVDMRGQTPTMMHVLALAETCGAVVSTTNALSMWTVIQGIPGFIACNAVLLSRENYFYRWIDREPNEIQSFNTSLNTFKNELNRWLERV